ncbi:unnamed protein product [Schistosoma turkestanicum]|nr:unnamed protein product [Schistosoma turkestanicum]
MNHTTNNEVSSIEKRITMEKLDPVTNQSHHNNFVKNTLSNEVYKEISPRSIPTDEITSGSKFYTTTTTNNNNNNHQLQNERIITIKDSGVLTSQANTVQCKSSPGKNSPTLSLNIDSDGYGCSATSLTVVAPRVAPKPKLHDTDRIPSEKKNNPTVITSEIRHMNSKVSSNLSNTMNMNSLLLNKNSNNIETLNNNSSTESATDLFPNLVKTRDTPIPNVKSLVSYFSELIRVHNDVQELNQLSLIDQSDMINKEKFSDYDGTNHHKHHEIHDENEDEYDLDIPASISPFLLHHETPTARERRLQAVEMLRRRSTIHMNYDPCRVFPPGYSTSTSPFFEKFNHHMISDNKNDCDNNNNNNDNNNDDNIDQINNIKKHNVDPVRRPLSAPKYQVRMQANLQKDSTAIAAQ